MVSHAQAEKRTDGSQPPPAAILKKAVFKKNMTFTASQSIGVTALKMIQVYQCKAENFSSRLTNENVKLW